MDRDERRRMVIGILGAVIAAVITVAVGHSGFSSNTPDAVATAPPASSPPASTTGSSTTTAPAETTATAPTTTTPVSTGVGLAEPGSTVVQA